MEQIDQLQQVNITASSQELALTPEEGRLRVRTRSLPALLWRNRVLIAGALSIGLAIAGEILMRSASAADPANPQAQPGPSLGWLGSLLMAVAAMLVGVVAWVNDGAPAWRKRSDRAIAGAESTQAIGESVGPIPIRTARARSYRQESAPIRRERLSSTLRSLAMRYSMLRAQAGWYGTALGLLVAVALCVWLGLILRADWHNPLAGWIWLAIMLVLLLTFAGLRPWPSGATLLAHDPAEPTFEPPIARVEWIILVIIMVAAVALRFWHLGSIPAGPYVDESGRAIDARNLNYGLPVNQETFSLFGTGWWGVPSFYFWLVAQSMKVFGDNLLGARVVHALAGVGTVWYTYRIGRVVWSPRVGLGAGALMAVSDLAIQASRTAGESTITLLCWTACFYYLYKALKTRQPVDFALAGLAGGFVLLGYASGKLLPLFLVPAALYLLLRWKFTGLKRYLPGLVLVAVVALAVCGPNLIFQLTQKPTAMMERYNSVTIFTPQEKAKLAGDYHTDNWGVIIGRQYMTAYSAYDVGQEKGPFYPTGQPVLPALWAALWVLGTAYMVWRLGDARYAIMCVWILAALGGSAFTIDTPTLQRALMIVPALALLPAIYLDRVATGFTTKAHVPDLATLVWRRLQSLLWRAKQPEGRRVTLNHLPSMSGVLPRSRTVVFRLSSLVIAAFVLFSAYQVDTYYFGPYTDKALYVEVTLAGRYMEQLDPSHDVVYDHGLPIMLGDPSPLLFLGKGITRHELGNAPDTLPVIDNDGKDVHFLVAPADDPLIQIIKSYYPGGTSSTLSKPDGTPVVAVYHVTAAEIDSKRVTTARYSMPDGALFEQQEPRLGTYTPTDTQDTAEAPAGIAYPATAEWAGGLVSPAYGTYRMELQAPAGATLDLDGQRVLTATAGVAPEESRVVLSKGVHALRLHASLDSAAASVELLWGTDNGTMVPVGKEFLWGGMQGALAGEVYYNRPDGANWLLPDQISPALGHPQQYRLDGTFSWSNINASLQSGAGTLVVWRGKLVAPAGGNYYFEAITPGMVTIRIDGKIVGISNVGTTPNQWPVNTVLNAGTHSFEMRYYSTQDGSPFRLVWQPPGQNRTVLTPAALLPPETGAWPASSVAPAPSPDNSAIHSLLRKNVQIMAALPADGWKEVIGIAVLPDGRYAVGDSGGHKLTIYDSDGKVHASWGGTASGTDTFNDVSDLTAGPDGTIVALDAENADIRVFTEEGRQLTRLPAAKLGLTHARGITYGPDGKYYVADTAGSRVVRVSQSGEVQVEFKHGSGSIQDLDQPVDVAVAPDGSVYVVDLRNRIVQFDSTGKAQHEWNVPVGRKNGAGKLALWEGLVTISNPDENSISALDPMGGILWRLTPVGNSQLQLDTPLGLAAGTDGNLYVVDSGHSRVVVLSKAKPAP